MSFCVDVTGALKLFKKDLRPRLKKLDTTDTAATTTATTTTAEGDLSSGTMTSLLSSLSSKNSTTTTSRMSSSPSYMDDLFTTYLGLIHLCGLSGRPDLALQIFYTMLKDGIGRTPRIWDAYVGGKEAAAADSGNSQRTSSGGGSVNGGGLFMLPSYESMLRLESTAQADEKIAAVIPWKRIRIKF